MKREGFLVHRSRESQIGVIGALVSLAFLAVAIEDGHYILYFVLGCMTFVLICQGTAHLFRSKRKRDILRHLTQEEQTTLNAMAWAYGERAGESGILVSFLVVAILLFFTGGEVTAKMVLYTFVVIFLSGLLPLPSDARERKEIRDFLANSEYARRTSPS